jgi:hypothetical protein
VFPLRLRIYADCPASSSDPVMQLCGAAPGPQVIFARKAVIAISCYGVERILIFSKSLIIASIVSGLGGLLFGFDNIVISGAIPYVSELFRLDASGVGWVPAVP